MQRWITDTALTSFKDRDMVRFLLEIRIYEKDVDGGKETKKLPGRASQN